MSSTSSYKRSIRSSSSISKTSSAINIDSDVIFEQTEDDVSVKSGFGGRMAIFWTVNVYKKRRRILKSLCWFSLIGILVATTKKPSTSKKSSKPKPKFHNGKL